MIPAFVITSVQEPRRQAHVALLHSQLPGLIRMEAIYPLHQKIPFYQQLIALSRQRTGTALNAGELGVLLSNRKVWREVVRLAQHDQECFLVLESDSWIKDLSLLQSHYKTLTEPYDLFFFGAWSGHMKLERSTKQPLTKFYHYGTPYIKTVYGAYGYSINKKGAQYLLQQTRKVSYPVDQFKRFIEPGALKIGGMVPELITHFSHDTMIGHPAMHPFKKKAWLGLLDLKNTIICFFK